METLNLVWSYVLPIGGGITVGAIIIFIATICFKGFANKLISRINIEKVEEKVVDKGIEKVKEISFKQSIEPLVKSELEKVTEQANKYIEESNEQTHKDLQKVLIVLKKMSAFFDDSVVISKEKKEDLKKTIDEALECPISAQEIVVEEIVKEDSIVENKKVKR